MKYKIYLKPPPRKSLYKPFESFVFGNCALFAKTITFFGSEPLASSSNTSGVRIKKTKSHPIRVFPHHSQAVIDVSVISTGESPIVKKQAFYLLHAVKLVAKICS